MPKALKSFFRPLRRMALVELLKSSGADVPIIFHRSVEEMDALAELPQIRPMTFPLARSITAEPESPPIASHPMRILFATLKLVT